MPLRFPYSLPAAFLVAILAGSPAPAANEGQQDFLDAVRAKLNARMLSDLDEVVRLCESAVAKGLDDENTRLANKLLAAALIDRAAMYSKTAFGGARVDPKWRDYRRLALGDLERALRLDPDRPEAPLRIAQLNLLPEGDQGRVIGALDEAVRRAENQVTLKTEALVLRAEVEKDPAKRLADLDQAAKLAPGDPSILRARGTLLSEQNKAEVALADLDAALKLDPDHVPTLEAKSTLLAKMKRYDEALATIEELRKLQPDSPAPLAQRAAIRAMKGDFKAALADLDEAEGISPNHAAVMLLRASIYQEMKEDAKALAEIDRLLAAKPGYPAAVRFRAGLLVGANKFDEAIAAVEGLLKAEPDDVEAKLQLATLQSAAKRHRKAIAIFSEVLQKDSDNWMALRGRGDARLGIGEHAEAIADYEKALKLRPKDSGLLNNFAWVLATSPVDKLRNGKRAVEMALEACRLTAYEQAHILSTLAAAYAESGDFKLALKWSQKAVELGKPEQKADLIKELESYKAGKPVRELKQEEPAEEERPRPKQGGQAPGADEE
jgi:tetratricopeptide (TPR) repeat protein